MRELVVATDAPTELARWVGDGDVPLSTVSGPCDLRSATIELSAGEAITLT